MFHSTPPFDRSIRLQSSNSGSLFQSNYASSSWMDNQDSDFSTPYSARARMYDLPSSNTFGPSHHMSSSSTSSLTGFGLGVGGGGGHLTPMPGSSGDHNKQPNPNTNLIINYLPQDMNERELHSLFSAMGPVDTVRVMRDLKVSPIINNWMNSKLLIEINYSQNSIGWENFSLLPLFEILSQMLCFLGGKLSVSLSPYETWNCMKSVLEALCNIKQKMSMSYFYLSRRYSG